MGFADVAVRLPYSETQTCIIGFTNVEPPEVRLIFPAGGVYGIVLAVDVEIDVDIDVEIDVETDVEIEVETEVDVAVVVSVLFCVEVTVSVVFRLGLAQCTRPRR